MEIVEEWVRAVVAGPHLRSLEGEVRFEVEKLDTRIWEFLPRAPVFITENKSQL